MNFLFFRNYPSVDGTLSIMMRYAKKLSEKGHNCTFLLGTPLNAHIKLTLDNICPSITVLDLPLLLKEKLLPQIDAIYAAVSGDDLLNIFTYRNAYFKTSSILFHPVASNTFIQTSSIGFSPDGLLYKAFLKDLPTSNIAFPTTGKIMQNHEQFSKRDFSKCFILPNALDILPSIKEKIKGPIINIVSITRLAPGKEYIFGLLDVVEKLGKQGYPFQLHIYGNGPYYDEIEEIIKNFSNKKNIILYGEIKMEEVIATLKNADFFIGMGGALLEAVSLGIPSLIAIEYNKLPNTYGWFHKQNDYEVGEYDPLKTTFCLFDSLVKVDKIDSIMYNEMAAKTLQRAQYYSIDVVCDNFVHFAKQADQKFNFTIPLWKRLALKLLRQPFKLFLISAHDQIHSNKIDIS